MCRCVLCTYYLYFFEISIFGLRNSVFAPNLSWITPLKPQRLISMKLYATSKWTLTVCTVLLFFRSFNFCVKKYCFLPQTFLGQLFFKMAWLISMKLGTTKKWTMTLCIVPVFFVNLNFWVKNSVFAPNLSLTTPLKPLG